MLENYLLLLVILKNMSENTRNSQQQKDIYLRKAEILPISWRSK